MDENLFRIILLIIPVLGAIITGYIVPLIKSNISANQLDEIIKWVGKAVAAAEVLFNVPKSGEEKREYVIDFIDKMFNKDKEVITKDQIRVLLEAAVKSMNDTTK